MLARASAVGATHAVSAAVAAAVVAAGPAVSDSRGGDTVKALSTSLDALLPEGDDGLLKKLRSSSSSRSSSLDSLPLLLPLLLPLADGEGGGGGLYSNRPSIFVCATALRVGRVGLR